MDFFDGVGFSGSSTWDGGFSKGVNLSRIGDPVDDEGVLEGFDFLVGGALLGVSLV